MFHICILLYYSIATLGDILIIFVDLNCAIFVVVVVDFKSYSNERLSSCRTNGTFKSHMFDEYLLFMLLLLSL